MSQDAKQVSKDERSLIAIPVESTIGKVGISEDVLMIMSGIAAMDVEGVASINQNAPRQLIAKLGMQSMAGGVKISEKDGVLVVNLNLNLDIGVNVADVSLAVQKKVKTVLENTTGLKVETVNVAIAGVALSDKKTKA